MATAVICHAQSDLGMQPGLNRPDYFIAPATNGGATFHSLSSPSLQNNPLIAETITPEIQSLARGLGNDPVRIFNYVHDNIRFVLYFGSKKGAELTLLEKSGNDFDQCALLVALLRAAGYSPDYGFGLVKVPYDATDGTHNDLRHWLGLTLVNSNWASTIDYFSYLFGSRGYPIFYPFGDNNTIGMHRVWVTLTVNSTDYLLDPAFKVSEPITGLTNLAAVMGLSSNAVMSAAGGLETANYVTNLNEAALRGTLTGYTTNLLSYLQSNYPNASVEQILGGQQITPSTNTILSQSLLFSQDTIDLPAEAWDNEPTNLMSSLAITFAGTNYQWWMPQLKGQRLSLTFTTNGLAQLWQDDTMLASNTVSSSSGLTNVVISVNHPYGSWDTTNNALLDNGNYDQVATNAYQGTNATYAIMYAFEPDWGWLQERQNQLDRYRQRGLPDTSREVVSETLNIMGLNWLLQTKSVEQIMAVQLGALPEYAHRIGRMAQEKGRGYYIDVYMQAAGIFSGAGNDTNSQTIRNIMLDASSYFSSAMEHGIIEQLQSSNLVAASTVKMLQIANTNKQAIFLATAANWSTVQGSLTGYDSATLSFFATKLGLGYQLLIPQNGSNHLAGTGSWAGYGAAARFQDSSGENIQMLISGAYHGGYSAFPNTTANPPVVANAGDAQQQFFAANPPFTFNFMGADPVDMADGTFQVEHTDLSLGQAEPRGITFSRYYNGTRRASNPAGMAPGWLHNYVMNAVTVSAPQAALGGTTPQQMASLLVATYAAGQTYNPTPDPKNWMVTALIAKWAVDQLYQNGVSVLLGKDTIQFIKQPNGVFTPPAGGTMTLLATNSSFWLQQRHGNTFKFSSAGRLTNIVDQYSQSLKVAYGTGALSNYVSTVTDWKGRTLTFNYTGNQLTSVTDGTRSIAYGYSGAGDLTTFTDAEGKITTYASDTNHQITAVIDAQSRLVVSNLYDGFGHVATQYTQGDLNKAWQIFWSGWQNIEQDPAGNQKVYFYDSQSRPTGIQDALGHLTKAFYDGQNHIVATVSALNETNQFIFDGNHNVIYALDPLGFTNQFIFDGQNNLIRAVDPLGKPNTFGYNTNFSLTGTTNGAGDWVNFTYNSDGTLHTRADAGGTTTNGFDSNGQLNLITYAGGLGSESFVNNAFGDPTSHTDGRGFLTTFKYNLRRELTNSVAPTNVSVAISFDPVGNVASTTDARGNTTVNTWSVTRQLLATTLPPTPQGTPMVTNLYDARDWLVKSINNQLSTINYSNNALGQLIAVTDPVQRTTTFGYDANGHKLATTNAAQEVTSQTRDARGSLVKLTDGEGHCSTRGYDSTGNQITLTNRNGKKWSFQFDGANRLTNTLTPLGRSWSVTFNNRGLVSASRDPANQITSLGYDVKGRLTNRTDNVGSTLYKWDAGDNMTNVLENGLTNSWSVDAYGRVSSYHDVFGNLIQYRYDASGNLTNLVYPGNKNVFYAYDTLNRLTNVTDWAQRQTSIGYDLNSRLTSIVRPNGSYRTIGYDAAGQATNILEQMSNSLPIAMFKLNWDNAARAQWEFAAPLPHSTPVPTRAMTYDDDNRLLTENGSYVTNDNNGNLTFAPLLTDTLVAYAYDARNRLLNAGDVTNAYDAMNNRIGQTVGTNSTVFVINPNAKLPQVLMRIKNGITNYYIYGPGLLYQITETATATNTLTYHYDYRGSTIALSTDSGLVTDRIEYSAYGLTTYHTGTSDTPFFFNGRYGVQTDPNGLLYMRSRYYNPYLCRFISADPSGFGGGMNHYAYANGNPVSLIDPFGLSGKATGDNSFNWIGASENSVPYMVGTMYPNAGLSPVLSQQGDFVTLPQAYLDPSMSYSYNWSSPGDNGVIQSLTVVAAQTAVLMAASYALEVTAGLAFTEGAGVRIAEGAGYESKALGGKVYTGGYDPAQNSVYLGDAGHPQGVFAAGGNASAPGLAGVTVVDNGTTVLWNNASPSLPAVLSDAQRAAVQNGLQQTFPGRTIQFSPKLR
jgi:RHS repeat-associated protein